MDLVSPVGRARSDSRIVRNVSDPSLISFSREHNPYIYSTFNRSGRFPLTIGYGDPQYPPGRNAFDLDLLVNEQQMGLSRRQEATEREKAELIRQLRQLEGGHGGGRQSGDSSVDAAGAGGTPSAATTISGPAVTAGASAPGSPPSGAASDGPSAYPPRPHREKPVVIICPSIYQPPVAADRLSPLSTQRGSGDLLMGDNSHSPLLAIQQDALSDWARGGGSHGNNASLSGSMRRDRTLLPPTPPSSSGPLQAASPTHSRRSRHQQDSGSGGGVGGAASPYQSMAHIHLFASAGIAKWAVASPSNNPDGPNDVSGHGSKRSSRPPLSAGTGVSSQPQFTSAMPRASSQNESFSSTLLELVGLPGSGGHAGGSGSGGSGAPGEAPHTPPPQPHHQLSMAATAPASGSAGHIADNSRHSTRAGESTSAEDIVSSVSGELAQHQQASYTTPTSILQTPVREPSPPTVAAAADTTHHTTTCDTPGELDSGRVTPMSPSVESPILVGGVPSQNSGSNHVVTPPPHPTPHSHGLKRKKASVASNFFSFSDQHTTNLEMQVEGAELPNPLDRVSQHIPHSTFSPERSPATGSIQQILRRSAAATQLQDGSDRLTRGQRRSVKMSASVHGSGSDPAARRAILAAAGDSTISGPSLVSPPLGMSGGGWNLAAATATMPPSAAAAAGSNPLQQQAAPSSTSATSAPAPPVATPTLSLASPRHPILDANRELPAPSEVKLKPSLKHLTEFSQAYCLDYAGWRKMDALTEEATGEKPYHDRGSSEDVPITPITWGEDSGKHTAAGGHGYHEDYWRVEDSGNPTPLSYSITRDQQYHQYSQGESRSPSHGKPPRHSPYQNLPPPPPLAAHHCTHPQHQQLHPPHYSPGAAAAVAASAASPFTKAAGSPSTNNNSPVVTAELSPTSPGGCFAAAVSSPSMAVDSTSARNFSQSDHLQHAYDVGYNYCTYDGGASHSRPVSANGIVPSLRLNHLEGGNRKSTQCMDRFCEQRASQLVRRREQRRPFTSGSANAK